MAKKYNLYDRVETDTVEYTELEYIETTGTQYIDTGVIPTLNTKVRVKFLPVAQNGIGFFGARTPASGTANRFTCTTFSSGTQLSAGMTVNEWPDFRISNYVGNLYDITIENGSTKVNDITYTTPTNTSVDFGNNTFKLIGVKDNGDVENDTQAKYYLCQIWESGVLVHYLVPVRRNSDNVVGMYDTVTDTFFINAGTGTFTVGPDVSTITSSGKDIGVVIGFQKDENDNEFAVVCLNAEYRLAPSPNDASVNNLIYIPSPTGDDNRLTIPGLIIYSYTQTPGANEWLETKETATYGTQKIIDHVNNTSGITSPAATHARSKSFVIDGTTYYGQIPNAPEMVKMMFEMTKINSQDPSRTRHSDKLLDNNIY